jgi:hypothetical protein
VRIPQQQQQSSAAANSLPLMLKGMIDWFSDVEVFAVYYRAGQWSVIAPTVRELSGRHGIRRIARVSDRSLRRQRSSPPRDHPLLRSPRRRERHAAVLDLRPANRRR